MVRRLISILLITIYAIIVGHDLMPHHFQKSACQIHNHSNVNSDRNDCGHSNNCSFPFHQHSMNGTGVFLNTSTLELNFDKLNLATTDLFSYVDIVLFAYEQVDVDFIPLLYKGPDFSSISFRGPPLA